MAKEIFRIEGRYSVVQLRHDHSTVTNNDFTIDHVKVKLLSNGEIHELQATNLNKFIYIALFGLFNLQTNKFEGFYYNQKYAIKQAKKRNKDYIAGMEKILLGSG